MRTTCSARENEDRGDRSQGVPSSDPSLARMDARGVRSVVRHRAVTLFTVSAIELRSAIKASVRRVLDKQA